MELAQLLQLLSDNVVVQVLIIVIAAASSIAALFPKPKKNKALIWLYHVINVLAINIRHAKNKGATDDETPLLVDSNGDSDSSK